MTDFPILTLTLVAAAGLALGGVFFGGLWWTVRRGTASPHPALWFLGSLLLRMGVVLTGFYYIGGGHMERWIVCLLGFVAARVLVSRATRLPVETATQPSEGNSHAP